MKIHAKILQACIVVLVIWGWSGAVDVRDTRLLSNPAIHGDQVAFMYDGDLWISTTSGGGVRRVTSHPGLEFNPVFSPDGRLLAFSAEYDGNVDVFVVSVAGGSPRRLTWHPGSDVALGFTVDGASVLFRSPRDVFTNRHTRLYTVPLEGGFPAALPIPNAHKAVYSPDGTRLAYTPLSERFEQWKHYRGGTVSRIWLYNVSDHEVVQIPQPEGRCNDTDPVWLGNTIFFRSDRNGEFNIFSYDVESASIIQRTEFTDFPVLSLSGDDRRLVFEQSGYLHLLEPDKNQTQKLKIGVASDLIETRPRFVKVSQTGPGRNYIRNSAISPSGARAVFEFRGEIITVPAEKGDARNLTLTTSAHERSPAWSPDGKSLAYFSDESGEYQLHIRDQSGKGEVRKFDLQGAGFYQNPKWSPDSTKIAFVDNSLSLFWLDLESGTSHKIGQEILYAPLRGRTIEYNWAPDSRWLAYTQNSATYIRRVLVHNVAENKSYPITDGLSDVSEPVFDRGGKYLYFLASTDSGPARQWFDLSNNDVTVSQEIYLAVLDQTVRSPFFKESDEESGETVPKEETNEKGEDTVQESPDVVMDVDGIGQRIVALPLPAGNYSGLQAGKSGELYFLEAPPEPGGSFPNRAGLKRFNMEKRKAETALEEVDEYSLSADGKKFLYISGETIGIVSAQEKSSKGQGKLAIEKIQVKIEPPAEWGQIFHEAWRINRDYFYDPNFHGADWEAMRDKYSEFLPHLATRADLNRVIQWMCSELSVGHHRVGGGDRLYQPERIQGGLLGADFSVENDRYRFAKIYGGLNWNGQLRAPLTEPGVDVRPGEYLLAVQGVELRYPTNLYSLFENTADKIIEITVGPNPDGSDSRTVEVVPVAADYALRNRDWVEGNIRKVHEATEGKVAYVYVPNTGSLGHTYFKRYFYPQADKQAIIVDERFNGGGQVADYYIDQLRKPVIAYWAMRYGEDLKTPSASIQGPKVMIIDETAGSGGDLLPWMWRKFKIGKLVGKRTWGGLVGILGFPVLMDGGFVTAPNVAIWTEEGFVVENEGVPPDIEVEQYPEEVIAGRDPQLEKAIEVIMAELRSNPPQQPKKPPYPQRARRP